MRMGGSYEEIEQTPQLLESPTNQAGIQGIQNLMGQNAPQVNLQGLGAEGQSLLNMGMGLIQQLQQQAQNPMDNQAYALGMGELEKVLQGGYDPMSSPYYEGIRQEADILTDEGVKQLMHGQQQRGTLASTPGMSAEAGLRAKMGASTLQELGKLYEGERGRMSQGVNQALGYAQLPSNMMGQALSGIGAVSPLATYGSDVANQQSITNAQLQSNWTGQQMQGYGAMSDYGTYYTNPVEYQPGVGDYLLGGLGSIGGLK